MTEQEKRIKRITEQQPNIAVLCLRDGEGLVYFSALCKNCINIVYDGNHANSHDMTMRIMQHHCWRERIDSSL